jgi:hypothetical protein
VDAPAVRRILAKQARLNEMTPREALRVEVAALEAMAPRVAFVLVPAFAGMLKLLQFRRKRVYAEHFVFALHFHAFSVLLATGALIVARSWFTWLAAGAVLLYLLLGMRRFYAESWLRTSTKFVVLAAMYLLTLTFATVALAIGSLLAA